MDPAVIALAAALALSLAVVAGLLRRVARRASPQTEAEVARAVGNLEQRMEELARELTAAVQRAEEETRRSRFLSQIGATMDLDDVLATTLSAAGALPRVDAALIQLAARDEEEPLVATSGFDGDEPDPATLFGMPDGNGARAVELSYRYGDAPEADRAVRAALGVPLLDHAGRVGWLGVFSRNPQTRFGDEDVSRLEELAERVAPALENARRFQEARHLADLDPLTGLHNPRFFHETLAREVARAHRYGRRLALVLVDAGGAPAAEAAECVQEAVQATDIPCRVGADGLGVILVESGLDEARRFVVRIEQAVAARPVAHAGRVRLSAGIAELQPQDDVTSLFERADASREAARQSRAAGGGLAAAD
ncbi:MAG TPA: diguanylate cyclase [Gaiellaceae bacterium]|nr:diguanylate cyclase [Gaiellaceae bacterium]